MSDTITAADRLALYERLSRYAYAMDRGDAAGVAACFTPDAVLTDARGVRFEGAEGITRFAQTAMRNPEFRGRQHHIRPQLLQPAQGSSVEDAYEVLSYYQVLRFKRGGLPVILSLGWYRDRMRRSADAGWLIASKTLLHWNADQGPRAGALGEGPLVRVAGAGAPRPGEPHPADRLAMTDLMFAYAGALDTGDLGRMQATFEPGAVLDTGGVGVVRAPEGVRAFLASAADRPGFAGRQHRIYPLRFDREGAGWKAFSYWKVETWTAGQPAGLVALGYYEDVFMNGASGWRFVGKTIRRWDSESAPMSPAWTPT